MNKIIFLILSFSLFALGATSKDFESSIKLGELWENEEIYFLPKNKNEIMNWSGVIYHYPTQKCLDQSPKEKKNNFKTTKTV